MYPLSPREKFCDFWLQPMTRWGKLIYRDVCYQRLPWDTVLPQPLSNRWKKLEKALAEKFEVPRSIAIFEERINDIQLHAFGDSSIEGTCAAVYTVVHQNCGVSQGLIAAKSRLAKKNLTTPRLELVSADMATTLVDNVKNAIRFPVTSVFRWLDSTTAMYWIKGNGSYKQFVENRRRKINHKNYITWKHVATAQNPADIGSRGCLPNALTGFWLKGLEWLPFPGRWPEDIVLCSSKEAEQEAKVRDNLCTSAEIQEDDMDELLQKFTFWNLYASLVGHEDL